MYKHSFNPLHSPQLSINPLHIGVADGVCVLVLVGVALGVIDDVKLAVFVVDDVIVAEKDEL